MLVTIKLTYDGKPHMPPEDIISVHTTETFIVYVTPTNTHIVVKFTKDPTQLTDMIAAETDSFVHEAHDSTEAAKLRLIIVDIVRRFYDINGTEFMQQVYDSYSDLLKATEHLFIYVEVPFLYSMLVEAWATNALARTCMLPTVFRRRIIREFVLPISCSLREECETDFYVIEHTEQYPFGVVITEVPSLDEMRSYMKNLLKDV